MTALLGAALGGLLGAGGGFATDRELVLPAALAGGVVGAIVASALASGSGRHPTRIPLPELPTTPERPFNVPPVTSDALLYRTPIDDVEMHPSGWAPLGGGIEITALPLVPGHPPDGILFARIDYDEYLELAKAWGLEPMTAQIGALAYEKGLRLTPCTLVRTAEDSRHMQSIEWCRRHDACVAAQLSQLWDGAQAVADAGKDWIVEPGRAPQSTDAGSVNWGWHRADGSVIQTPGHRHERSYTDYSQLSRFWRRV